MNHQERPRPKLIRADSQLRNKWLATVSILIFIPVLLLWSLSPARGHLHTLFIENDSNTAFSLLIFIYSLISILAIMLINAGMEIIQVARKVQQSGYNRTGTEVKTCELTTRPSAVNLSCSAWRQGCPITTCARRTANTPSPAALLHER